MLNDNRNILYVTDFFISKNWRLYFFLTDLLNFFFIFQSPEQIWGAFPKFLYKLPNPWFFSTVMVCDLTIRHLFEHERSLWRSFLGFWAKKCDFFKKTQKNCNLDFTHSSCIFLTSVQALALYSSGKVLYMMLFKLTYFIWGSNFVIWTISSSLWSRVEIFCT